MTIRIWQLQAHREISRLPAVGRSAVSDHEFSLPDLDIGSADLSSYNVGHNHTRVAGGVFPRDSSELLHRDNSWNSDEWEIYGNPDG